LKAFQLIGLREMVQLDAPDPKIEQPTDVLIKLGALGVCGSDIHYYSTGRIGILGLGPIGRTVLLPAMRERCRAAYCTDKVRRKEITLVNIRRQRGCVQTALDLIGTCRPDVEALITHQFPFSDAI
jgi:threonine dehydrogenase-like Zn-dependent dehydrogenase